MRIPMCHPVKRIDSVTTQNSGQTGKKIEFVKLTPKGFAFAGIMLKLNCAVRAGATATGRVKDLRAIIEHALGKFHLYSTLDQSRPYFQTRCTGNHARILYMALQQKELKNNVVGTSYTTATNYTATIYLYVPFRADAQLMGYSQFSSLVLEYAEGTSDTITSDGPTFSRVSGGTWQVDVWPVGMPSARDTQINPISVLFNDTVAEQLDFSESGCPLLLVDTNAAHDATDTTLSGGQDLTIGGVKYMEQVPLSLIREGIDAELRDAAAPNFIDAELVTNGCGVACLYMARRDAPVADLPHGPLIWRQYGIQVAAPKLVLYCYRPNLSTVAAEAAKAKAEDENTAVMARVNAGPCIGRHSRGSIATASVELVPSSDASFATGGHGILSTATGQVAEFVSSSKLDLVKKAASALPDDGTRSDAIRAAQKMELFQVPGAVNALGRSVPSAVATREVRASLSRG